MMKKILLFLFVLFLGFQQITFAQCGGGSNPNVCRAALAGLIFNNVYADNLDVDDYDAVDFPNPYVDLQDDNELHKKLKILSYLQYDNGLTVFHYSFQPSSCFKPTSEITKVEALINIMEAWNIEPDYSGSSPFNDVPSDSYIHGYVNRAHDEGLLNDNGSNFYPYDPISESDTVEIINNVLNSSFHPVNENLEDIDNYFIPGIYDPTNISKKRGLNQGVFDHYAKNSFVIPDRKMSLNFSHFYSTMMVELNEGFYPIRPIGRGWSHTYNSYITFENDVGEENDDYYFIVWPDGTIHIYNEDENEYESKGVYDDFDELNSGIIRIEKKDQSRYYYEQLDDDKDIWYLIEIRDQNGNRITIEYESAEEDDTRRIEYVEAPSGKSLEFRYLDDTDLIDKISDPIGRDIFFEYSGTTAGWVYNYPVLVAFEDAKNNFTTYSYGIDNPYDIHLLNRIDLPRGNQILAEYDNNGKLEEYQMDGEDPVEIEVEYDYPDDEEIVTVTSPVDGGGGFVEEYEFNENGLVVDYESTTDDLNIDYPGGGMNVMLPDHTNLNGVDIDYEYDSDGNVTEINKENGDIVEYFDYDSNNNLIEYTDPNGNVTEYVYDGNENLLEILDAEGGVVTFQYDQYGQLLSQTNQAGITVDYTYENDGAVSSITMPENISSSFNYDGINRLLSQNDNGLVSSFQYDDNDNRTSFTNSGGFVTTYDYDQNDNLTTITNAHNVSTSFEYDDQDRVIQEQFANLVTEYEYSDEGYLESMTKPSGQIINYEYDDEGRPEETGTITDIDYNNRNLIESITNDTGTITFDYDDINRVEDITTVHGYVVEYEFEDSGHLDEITYPTIDGVELEVNYSYDDKNRVFQVIVLRNVGNDGQVIAEYDYLDDDRIEKIEVGNNTRTDYSYDGAGRLNYIEHFKIGAPTSFYFVNHTLDNRGNITNSTESFEPFPTGYIDHGSSSETATYDYNDNNHILNVNSTDYDVDDDGNTIDEQNSFEGQYDIDDRLTEYDDLDNNTNYEYNPYNQRVEVTRDGVRTHFIRDVLNDRILVELDQSNNVKYYYIYHPSGMLLARMKPNGNLQYYHNDIRGSVTMMTDENGEITHQYQYEDFGWITKSFEPNADPNRFRYVGGFGVEYDKHDLYYMRARYYKPSIGRFLTEDPVWHTNLYPYADNNPVSRIDPLGTSSISTNDPSLSDMVYNTYYTYAEGVNDALKLTHSDFYNVSEEANNYSNGVAYKTGAYVGYSAQLISLAYAISGTIGTKVITNSSTKWSFGRHKSATKWSNRLKSRNWTHSQIDEAISGGQQYKAINNINKSNSATRYVHPTTGKSIVKDDVTNEILHIGTQGYKY